MTFQYRRFLVRRRFDPAALSNSLSGNGYGESPRSGRRLPNALRALNHRNFRLFASGQIVSLVGTWMQRVAEAWLVYRLTGSPVMLGLVAFCSQIPVFLVAPVGGAVADRYDRHRVVIATQAASMLLACILAALTLSDRVRIWQVFLLASLLGIVNAFDIPSRQAFIADMVGRDDLMNAIALNSSMVNGARMAGPAIAGILVAAIGEGWCFFINGVSYVAVITGLLMMRVQSGNASRPRGSAIANILEGFRFAGHTAPIRALLLLLGLVSLVGMPYAVLMPIFATDILHSGARGLGLLLGASGLGALAGAVSLTVRKGVHGLGNWVAISAAGFGACLILFSQSQSLWLSVVCLVPAGCFMMVQMASSNTLVQSMVPDTLRGRVMAVYTMMFMGMAPFGALVEGALARPLGAPLTVALGGSVCIAGAALFRWYLPSLREEGRALIVAQQMVGGHPPEEMTGGAIPLAQNPR